MLVSRARRPDADAVRRPSARLPGRGRARRPRTLRSRARTAATASRAGPRRGRRAAALRGMSLLGFYSGAVELDYPALESLAGPAWTAGLLPFTAAAARRARRDPRARLPAGPPAQPGEAGLRPMALAPTSSPSPSPGGLIASGEADRPMERYRLLPVPLALRRVLRSTSSEARRARLLYAGLALGARRARAAATRSRPAVDFRFSFDSPTLSAFAELGRRIDARRRGRALRDRRAARGLALAALAARGARPSRPPPSPASCVLAAGAFATYAADRRDDGAHGWPLRRRSLTGSTARPSAKRTYSSFPAARSRTSAGSRVLEPDFGRRFASPRRTRDGYRSRTRGGD